MVILSTSALSYCAKLCVAFISLFESPRDTKLYTLAPCTTYLWSSRNAIFFHSLLGYLSSNYPRAEITFTFLKRLATFGRYLIFTLHSQLGAELDPSLHCVCNNKYFSELESLTEKNGACLVHYAELLRHPMAHWLVLKHSVGYNARGAKQSVIPVKY